MKSQTSWKFRFYFEDGNPHVLCVHTYLVHSCYITSNHSKFRVRYLMAMYQWKYPSSLNKDFYFIHLSFYEMFLEYSYQKRNVSWISLKNCSRMELKVLCLTWYIQRNELVPNANLERISPKCEFMHCEHAKSSQGNSVK